MFQVVFSVHHQKLKTAHTASRIGLTNTWRCMCSFELLMMDGKKHLKHVQRLTEINKLWNAASNWLYSANILAMHWPMNDKFRKVSYCFVVSCGRGEGGRDWTIKWICKFWGSHSGIAKHAGLLDIYAMSTGIHLRYVTTDRNAFSLLDTAVQARSRLLNLKMQAP